MTLHYTNDGQVHYQDLRERLYWNKYTYRGRIQLPHGARYRVGDTLATFMNRIVRYWLSDRSRKFVKNNPGIYDRYYEWRKSVPNNVDLACRSEAGFTAFYCNDLELLRSLNIVHDSLILTRAVVATKKSGTKWFRSKPKHNYRVYLRSCHVSEEQFGKLIAWLHQHNDKFTMSPAFSRTASDSRVSVWSGRRRYLSSSYFIDYDVESLESYLHLMWSDILGHQYQLLQYHDEQSTAAYTAPSDSTQDSEA